MHVDTFIPSHRGIFHVKIAFLAIFSSFTHSNLGKTYKIKQLITCKTTGLRMQLLLIPNRACNINKSTTCILWLRNKCKYHILLAPVEQNSVGSGQDFVCFRDKMLNVIWVVVLLKLEQKSSSLTTTWTLDPSNSIQLGIINKLCCLFNK